MRTVRCLILLAACGAAASHAQGIADPAQAGPQAASAPGVSVPGLRISPGLRMHRDLGEDDIPVILEGDRMDGDPDTDVTLTGNAQVRRIDSVLKGERIRYRRGTGELDAEGGVRLLRDGSLVVGPRLHYNVDQETGNVDEPSFWIGANGGSGRAEYADIFSRSRMRLTNVVYTGCPCPDPAWEIRSSRVDLDFDENEGVARNGVLYFKNVPILASPYLTFPVKNERKSGFLLPTYGTTSKGGFDLTVPYYFNLAPNYDLTVMPRLLTKRGVQLGGEFRYLGQSYIGQVSGAYLPDDRVAGRSRWIYSMQHYQRLGGGFYLDWDVNGASDDDYFRDISSVGLNEASTTHLPRRGRLGWNSRYWSAYVQAYSYQTLQDPDSPIMPPYDMLPEFSLRGARYGWKGLDLQWDNSAIWFKRPDYLGRRIGPEGQRFTSYPTISYPIVRPGWYVTPKAGVHMTQYQTNWYGTNWYDLPGGQSAYRSTASRSLPILSLDSGMTFERDTTLFGKDSIQTLEPRIYYLYVPYRDQEALPIYDTSLATFSFAQAFDENIYSGGWDRIANANQVTLGLTTRWLDAGTGFERLSLSGAQRIYFDDQRVGLPGEVRRTGMRSDFLVSAEAALTDTLSTQVTAQFNPTDDRWERSVISARWRPQRLASVGVSYRYTRTPPAEAIYLPRGKEQVSVYTQWPFSQKWYGVGRVDYSLEESRVTQSIAGLEYKGDCCWAARAVLQRYAVSAQDANTALFFQLELTGLGSLGTDPMQLLSRSIPGYEPINPSLPAGTTFERYE
ncbi:LPS-assembly protein LptD [Orrella sp. JC864]|uniref:LPS-assembly protein LptD n=1 Tax=Orrella sp. JC864 TaxID=3120298 RepID=UPI00300879F2